MIQTTLILLAYIAGIFTRKFLFENNKTDELANVSNLRKDENIQVLDSGDSLVKEENKLDIEKLIENHNKSILDDMNKIRLKSQEINNSTNKVPNTLIEYDEAVFV